MGEAFVEHCGGVGRKRPLRFQANSGITSFANRSGGAVSVEWKRRVSSSTPVWISATSWSGVPTRPVRPSSLIQKAGRWANSESGSDVGGMTGRSSGLTVGSGESRWNPTRLQWRRPADHRRR